jgi:hypothetical protein
VNSDRSELFNFLLLPSYFPRLPCDRCAVSHIVSRFLSAPSLSTITPSQRQPNARIGYNFLRGETGRGFRVRYTPPEALNATNKTRVQFNMKHFIGIFPLLLSVGLMVGCASEFQSNGSGSSADQSHSVTANDPQPPVSSPDTSIQDSIDRTNQQMATDAANAAAQQQFLAGMAAAQETENQHNDEFNQNGLH